MTGVEAATSAGVALNSAGHVPVGVAFPNGLGGAKSNGGGGVLSTRPVRDAARARTWAAIDAATDGVPMLAPSGAPVEGVHRISWADVTNLFAFGERRSDLAAQLGRAADALYGEGVELLGFAGSFATTGREAKLRPGDVDALVVPGRDGEPAKSMEWLSALVKRHAPDVHVYKATSLLRDAPGLAGATPGESMLEFFAHDRTGVRRGVLLLDLAQVVSERRAAASAIGDAVAGAARLLR